MEPLAAGGGGAGICTGGISATTGLWTKCEQPVSAKAMPANSEMRSIFAVEFNLDFVIPAKAGLRRQDAEANIGEADGPEGAPQERRVIQCLFC